MEDPNFMERPKLPALVREALNAIWDGQYADALESEFLEFKSDPTRHQQGSDKNAKLFEILLKEAICFANGGSEGYVVVGVEDKVAGPEAFTGCRVKIEKLQSTISSRTTPSLEVDVWTERIQDLWPEADPDTELVIIRIPAKFELYTRKDGGGSYRRGNQCSPLTEEVRQQIKLRSLNPDATAAASELSVDDLDDLALAAARRLLKNVSRAKSGKHQEPLSNRDLLKYLNLLHPSGKLTKAAEILFAPPSVEEPMIRYFWRELPTAEPSIDYFIEGPLLLAKEKLNDHMAAQSSFAVGTVTLSSGQELPIKRVPSAVIDEVITNALVHRDWQRYGPVTVDQNPMSMLVHSPGALVEGVSVERLLSTVSQPRNPTLMRAMRMLGLAEEASRGFDRMWQAMLKTGRPAPTVEATPASFSVRVSTGQPDMRFVEGLVELEKRFTLNNYAPLVILWELHHEGRINLSRAVELLQTDQLTARDTLDYLCQQGMLASPPVRGGIQARWWVMSQATAEAFPDEQHVVTGVADSPVEWVRAMLESGAGLTTTEVSETLNIGRAEVTKILRQLRTSGYAQIDPTGPQRGPGTRWIRT